METITAAQYRNGAHRVIPKPLDGEAVPRGILRLTAPPPSLNNAFVNGKKGRFKSSAYKGWQGFAQTELRRQAGWHVPGKVTIRILYSRADTKADLDNLIKPVLDLLVAAGRISDDRNVVKIEAEFTAGLGVSIDIRAAAQARAA